MTIFKTSKTDEEIDQAYDDMLKEEEETIKGQVDDFMGFEEGPPDEDDAPVEEEEEVPAEPEIEEVEEVPAGEEGAGTGDDVPEDTPAASVGEPTEPPVSEEAPAPPSLDDMATQLAQLQQQNMALLQHIQAVSGMQQAAPPVHEQPQQPQQVTQPFIPDTSAMPGVPPQLQGTVPPTQPGQVPQQAAPQAPQLGTLAPMDPMAFDAMMSDPQQFNQVLNQYGSNIVQQTTHQLMSTLPQVIMHQFKEAEARENLVKQFYNDNSDLNEHRVVVQNVMQTVMAQHPHMPITDVIKEAPNRVRALLGLPTQKDAGEPPAAPPTPRAPRIPGKPRQAAKPQPVRTAMQQQISDLLD